MTRPGHEQIDHSMNLEKFQSVNWINQPNMSIKYTWKSLRFDLYQENKKNAKEDF